ncbi:MAG: hypothetical protein AMXMBFR64_38820 [Myxococcales bacterium]
MAPSRDRQGAVISIGGPPHSGKSVFAHALNKALASKMGDEVFLERCNPDGEGNWAYESPPELVQAIRVKNPFSDDFVRAKLAGIAGLRQSKRVVLLDLGGKIAPDIHQFLSASTHALLVSGDDGALEKWKAAVASANGCQLLGALRSTLVRTTDGTLDAAARSTVCLIGPAWTGGLVNLDREGPNEPYSAAVSAIAEHIAVIA